MSALDTGRAVLDRARAAELPFLAAAIAYYALISVVPALVLAVAVATALGGADLATQVGAITEGLLTAAGQALVEDALSAAAGRVGASALGLVLLGWGALKVFRALDVAFSRIYGTTGDESFVEQVGDAVVALVTIGAGLVGMLVLGGVLVALPIPSADRLVGLVLLLLGLFVVFLPLYYGFPDTPVTVREVAPGAALAAVGWVGLQAAFQTYAAVAPSYELYGVLGGLLLLVTWFYLAAALLLVAAVVNAVRADRDGDRQAEMPTDRPFGSTMDASDDERSLEEQVAALREAVEALESRLEDHTVPRAEVESDLKRYVRSRFRRGHARGWGPYLVLLYGTAMTVGAFYLLSGGWAILAMVVIWLSTLGLYVVFVLAGAAIGVLDLPRRGLDAIRDRRS